MVIWGDFQELTAMTRGGGQKIGNWGDVIYGWSLMFLALKTELGLC